MRASAETVTLLTTYYEAMAANNPEEYGSYYAEDMTLTFGNSPEIRGRGAIVASMSDMLSRSPRWVMNS